MQYGPVSENEMKLSGLSLHYQKLYVEGASPYLLAHCGEQCTQMLCCVEEVWGGSTGSNEQVEGSNREM